MNPQLSRSLPLSFLFLTLSACSTVPLPGRGLVNPPSLRPVKPLMEGRGNAVVASKDSKNSTNGIKLETPNSKSGKPAQSGTKSLSTTELKAKLQEAEDKSASARSLSQSAETLSSAGKNPLTFSSRYRLKILPSPPKSSRL